MRADRRLIVVSAVALLGAALLLGLWVAGTVALVGADLVPAERLALRGLLEPRLALLVLTLLVLLGALVLMVKTLYEYWALPAARLLEQAQVLASTDIERELPLAGSAELRGLAQVLNEFARQRGELKRDVRQQVADASRGVEQERNRLAALMSELTQSVVVCNLDGRILLYNNRARLQFRALSEGAALMGGAELIGLGRSIYKVFDRKLVAHALDSVQLRLQRGVANPSAQFVTSTQGGQLLRVQMAPVRSVAAETSRQHEAEEATSMLSGFVLMLDNITREFEQETERDQHLHHLSEGNRGSLANMQAAAELLSDPGLDAATRDRLATVMRDEIHNMTQRMQTLTLHSSGGLATRWPLEDMLGADLVIAAQRRIETLAGVRVRASELDAALWLRLDSFSLLQALAYLAGRLHEDYGIKDFQLRLSGVDEHHAHLDLVWTGQAMSTETVMTWETDPMRIGSESISLTIREVVKRHGGEFWFERERVRQQALFRFLLPRASESLAIDATTFVHSASRPEYYDFDLFRMTESTWVLDERRLVDLTFTVFDTETTGLEPSAGDEIIQIGAVRVLNGRLLRAEAFEQLVDPQRSIPAASIPIHGIRPEMVQGQPTIAAALPAFHAYAHDTVLVAHNAAFDMRFLELKQDLCGVRFDQPVLDTLLLSAVVHPNQDSHRLEAIAERFEIPVIGRHTALGDAMVTAEVLLKLIPLLAEKGIHTLGQAREAAQKTYFARVNY